MKKVPDTSSRVHLMEIDCTEIQTKAGMTLKRRHFQDRLANANLFSFEVEKHSVHYP